MIWEFIINVARRRKSGFWAKLADLSTAASLVLIVAFAAAYFGKLGESEHQGSFSVVDGDSLTLGMQKFRLEGIDAPEYRQICQRSSGDWRCGRDAATYLRRLIQVGNVRCRGFGIDKYDRTLVRCSSDGVDINGEMVKNGWAVAFGSYYQLEREAKSKRLGIWEGDFQRPQEWRQHHGSALDQDSGHDWLYSLGAKVRLWWSTVID